MVKTNTKIFNVFYRFWYWSSNGIIADVVLHHFDLHFQGQTFSYYAFEIKIVQWQWMFPEDLPQLARSLPWSCSCFIIYALNNRCSVVVDNLYSRSWRLGPFHSELSNSLIKLYSNDRLISELNRLISEPNNHGNAESNNDDVEPPVPTICSSKLSLHVAKTESRQLLPTSASHISSM